MNDTERPARQVAHVEQSRTVHTYAELWHASLCLLEAGQREERGSVWQILSSIVMTAFAFEAYLNHLGEATHEATFIQWDRQSVENKYQSLAVDFGVSTDWSRRPLQTIRCLYQFRNDTAHGRTAFISNIRPEPCPLDKVDERLRRQLRSDWERVFDDHHFALRTRQDVEDAANRLRRAMVERDVAAPFIDQRGLGIGTATIRTPLHPQP